MGRKETRIREASGRDRLVPERVLRAENQNGTIRIPLTRRIL